MLNRLLALIGAFTFLPQAFAQAPVDYRLPPGITPTAQSIHLRLEPAQPDYTGETTIRIDIDEPTSRIGVYQLGLDMQSITLSGQGGERTLTATAGEWDISWLSDGQPIAAGSYTLSIDFSGSYSTDALGMHRVTFEGNDYVFTQMEAMYARRAFPLFDEPSFKLSYQLTISAPKGLTVVANTPVESTSDDGDWQRVAFMETKPLPSYLLAYAVGPLDRAPLEGISVPGYIYTPKGHTDKLGFVQRETPKIVAYLEDFFGSDYPFRKLDFVAVPDFAFGAMENPGLITYRTDLLLIGDEASGATAEQTLMVIAHEVAHIWYGDVVTMAWWDDLWLNEAFASWMAWSTVEDLFPQYDSRLKLPQAGAFGADQQTTAKPIRKTVRSDKEIFDGLGLNYTKGHAILNMLENYVGPEVWQRAIRQYVDTYAWRNATEADLWAIVSSVSGLDISGIAGDYLNQAGHALVSVDASGDVEQTRFRMPGREMPELQWKIPLNVKYKSGDDVRQTFYLLDEKSGSIDLPDNADWVFPDAGGNGYFRWSTDLSQLYALVDDADLLDNREKIALLGNSDALFNAGELTLADYLFVLNKLLADEYPLVFLPTLEKLKQIGDEFVDSSTEEAFSAFVDAALAARFSEVGAESRPGDSEALIQMRPRLMRMLGEYGSDSSVREAAADLARRFLAEPGSVEDNLAREALRVTAMNNDGSLYDDYIDAYRSAENANEKTVVLTAVYFEDAETIREHLDFAMTDEVASGDAQIGLSLYAGILEDNTIVFDWLESNFDAFSAKLPAYYKQFMPQVVGGGCSEASLGRLKAFFADRDPDYQTSLAKAEEAAQGCISRRNKHAADLRIFLANYDGD